jgi:hypothetical protein
MRDSVLQNPCVFQAVHVEAPGLAHCSRFGFPDLPLLLTAYATGKVKAFFSCFSCLLSGSVVAAYKIRLFLTIAYDLLAVEVPSQITPEFAWFKCCSEHIAVSVL